ncbi:MAG TPA: ABC transporter permease [Candidatus Competibacter sp.]|nr:ABC transporter permease [Candidatus Competibacter sp.]HUM93596.1 ABC transporter permease [Candidatus Competibacter sp.]
MIDRTVATNPRSTAEVAALAYDSDLRPPPFVDELVQLWRYRDLVLLLTGNILKNRYKRSLLGILWMLLNPLLQTIVLAIAFGALFQSALPHYPIYLLSGLLAWNFVTQTTQYAMGVMAGGGGLLKRIYIPRATYIVAVVGNGLVNSLVSIVPLLLVMIVFQHPLGASWAFLPFSLLILTAFTLGLALLLSTASVFFTDSIDIYQIVVQAGFFLTPIMYPPSVLPGPLNDWLLLNPFYLLIELFRTPIYANAVPDAGLIASATALALATLLTGWTVFTRRVDQLAYRL